MDGKLARLRAEKEAERRERSKKRRSSLLGEISSEIRGVEPGRDDSTPVKNDEVVSESLFRSLEKVGSTLSNRRCDVTTDRVKKEEQRKKESRERRNKMMKDIANEIGEDNTGATKQVFDAISKINDRLAEKRKSSHSISSKLPTVHTEKISRDPSSRSADMLPGAAQGPMRPEKLQEIQKAPEGLERDQKRATARESRREKHTAKPVHEMSEVATPTKRKIEASVQPGKGDGKTKPSPLQRDANSWYTFFLVVVMAFLLQKWISYLFQKK